MQEATNSSMFCHSPNPDRTAERALQHLVPMPAIKHTTCAWDMVAHDANTEKWIERGCDQDVVK